MTDIIRIPVLYVEVACPDGYPYRADRAAYTKKEYSDNCQNIASGKSQTAHSISRGQDPQEEQRCFETSQNISSLPADQLADHKHKTAYAYKHGNCHRSEALAGIENRQMNKPRICQRAHNNACNSYQDPAFLRNRC